MNPILCEGEHPLFLIFDFSTAPLLLFYTYIPAIVVALMLGFFVLVRDKSIAGRLLFLITLCFSLWVLDILVLWVASYNDALYFGWQLTPVFEVPLFIFSSYFTLVMTTKDRGDISGGLKIFFLSIMAAVLVLIPSKFNILNYDITNCEGTPGLLYWFMYIGEIVTIGILSMVCIVRFFESPKHDPFRREILYIGTSIVSFLVLFTGSNLIGQMTGIQQISFLGSLGMVIFLGILVYLIVKYKEFNIKLLATQALMWCLTVAIGAQFFFITLPVVFVLNGASFIAIIIFGHFLTQSVKLEVEQRERIEKLATDLATANEQLKDLDRQKDELLSIVSHQLAAPVTSIKWYLELLRDGDLGSLQKDQLESIGTMQGISTNLADLVGMILDVSRIQLGRMRIDPVSLDLNVFFKEILDTVTPKAVEKKQNFLQHLPKQLPTVLLDKRYTRMTVENLLTNAIKYTPMGGAVELTVEVRGDKLFCSVKDTGCGIPAEEQSKIFSKMYRASNVRNQVDGNGFGLYVAKGAIEAQGGRIWFDSTEGKGTTFSIELPIKTAA